MISGNSIMGFSNSLDLWLSKAGRSRKQAVAICVDGFLVVLSLWLAYTLRYGIPFNDFQSVWYVFLLLPVCTVCILMCLSVYRWVVRSSNSVLFRQLVKGSIVSSILLILITFLLPSDRETPRSLFVIYGILLTINTIGVRYFWRMLFARDNKGEPIAIYGAGVAGRQLLTALMGGDEYQPVVLIDDDPTIVGTMVCGLPVVSGNNDDLLTRLNAVEVKRVVFAMPSIKVSEYQCKIEALTKNNLKVQTMPSYPEMVTGSAQLSQVRDISITDILGRSEVPPDIVLLEKCVRGKSVLVTGGGGSIGSELCRQIASLGPASLVIVDHSEENLYKISEELIKTLEIHSENLIEFIPVLGSVTDKKLITRTIRRHQINTIYHAAAYKHVPIVEAHPAQGVNVNIFGTKTVLDVAVDEDVENFTLISTDKAVRPTNVMGATKRIAELILQAKASAPGVSTHINMVRFGNVLGSSGSVVLKFKKQIESGGPLTLTHPDMTRYFMTIPEAAQLVLQASAIGEGGEVFVLDMGEPVRIEDLATTMVKLLGKKLKRDTAKEGGIEIVVEGLRPGEKMYEEMFLSSSFELTKVSKIFVAKESWINSDTLESKLKQLKACETGLELRNLVLDLAFMRNLDESSSNKAFAFTADVEISRSNTRLAVEM